MSNSGTFTATGITGINANDLWIKDSTHSISAVHNNISVTPLETIQGQCLLAQKSMAVFTLQSALDANRMEEEIKKQLVHQLAEEMMRARCVEFTKQVDGFTGEYVFRARIFVTPDHQVRTLRQANVIK